MICSECGFREAGWISRRIWLKIYNGKNLAIQQYSRVLLADFIKLGVLLLDL